MTATDLQARPEFSWQDTAPEPTRPSLIRLVRMELRKMIDTRAGSRLLLVLALGSLALVAAQLRWGAPEDATFAGFFEGLMFPMGLLLPVLGILTVTGEWSHRTALTTFTLVPQRLRIVTAKLGAAVVLAVAGSLVALVSSAIGNLLAIALDRGDGSWQLSAFVLLHAVLWHALSVVMGVGFGMLLISAPLAISVYFVLPTAWTVAVSVVDVLEDVAGWVDVDTAMDQISRNPQVLTGWAQLSTGVLLWIGVPLFLGSIRLLRREIT